MIGRPRWIVRTVLLLVVVAALAGGTSAAAAPARIRVALWFDTEDYILPASDDAALRIAAWLSDQRIRATFKVVGEKARVLERRGRTDVIAALARHEIGFHTNWHSVQPTPAAYLSPLGWAEGVLEFDRRERPGFDDVARVFGQKPTCYGQPGNSWGPQSYGALRRWGVPVYLDVGGHVGLDGKPFYYCGVLSLFRLTATTRCELGGSADLEAGVEAVHSIFASRSAPKGAGWSAFITTPASWCTRNSGTLSISPKRANPPREAWQLPPVKTAEDQKIAWGDVHQLRPVSSVPV